MLYTHNVSANTNIRRFPAFHALNHEAFDPPHDPHRVHHVLGPVIATVGTFGAALAAGYYANGIITGETAGIAAIASLIFVPIVSISVFALTFLLSRAFGKWHSIGTVIGLVVGIGLMALWTQLWINSFRASPAEVLRQKAASAKSVADCAKLESDQAYWRDCMIGHLKTDKDFATCLSQANQFVRPFSDSESASATCGIVYAHVKNDVGMCDKLGLIDDQKICVKEFGKPLQTSTGN